MKSPRKNTEGESRGTERVLDLPKLRNRREEKEPTRVVK